MGADFRQLLSPTSKGPPDLLPFFGFRGQVKKVPRTFLIIQLDAAIQVEDEVVCCWVCFFCCCWAGGVCVFDKTELHAHLVVNFVKDGWVFRQEFLGIF